MASKNVGNISGRTHGYRPGGKKTKEYTAWTSMKSRCLNHNNPAYKDYGGRGISVCSRWLSFPPFLEDMGVASQGMTLERNDNNGNYGPNNCRWATRAEQSRNTRKSVRLTYQGITMTMVEWSRSFGLDENSVHQAVRIRGTDWNKYAAKRFVKEAVHGL